MGMGNLIFIMVTAGGNRQATDIDVKVFTNGNSLTNIRALQQWIKDDGLTRDRLISITANETDIEDGDNVLTIFYRKKQIKADSIPLDNIAYEAFNKHSNGTDSSMLLTATRRK